MSHTDCCAPVNENHQGCQEDRGNCDTEHFEFTPWYDLLLPESPSTSTILMADARKKVLMLSESLSESYGLPGVPGIHFDKWIISVKKIYTCVNVHVLLCVRIFILSMNKAMWNYLQCLFYISLVCFSIFYHIFFSS